MFKRSMVLMLCLSVLSVSSVYGWGRKKKEDVQPKFEYAAYGDTIKIHYTGKFEDGTVFDSSRSKDPFEFKLGEGSVLPAIEEAIIGMTEGENKSAVLAPEKAYGPFRKELIKKITREKFPENVELKVGLYLKIKQENGKPALVRVIGLDEATVTLDANHPLAGKTLVFDIELIDII